MQNKQKSISLDMIYKMPFGKVRLPRKMKKKNRIKTNKSFNDTVSICTKIIVDAIKFVIEYRKANFSKTLEIQCGDKQKTLT